MPKKAGKGDKGGNVGTTEKYFYINIQNIIDTIRTIGRWKNEYSRHGDGDKQT